MSIREEELQIDDFMFYIKIYSNWLNTEKNQKIKFGLIKLLRSVDEPDLQKKLYRRLKKL